MSKIKMKHTKTPGSIQMVLDIDVLSKQQYRIKVHLTRSRAALDGLYALNLDPKSSPYSLQRPTNPTIGILRLTSLLSQM